MSPVIAQKPARAAAERKGERQAKAAGQVELIFADVDRLVMPVETVPNQDYRRETVAPVST